MRCTNDWGITLINGGKVCVGIGNPDVTLFSPNDYNDGNWHHVAVRRNMATSFVELFIDSVLVASGNTINTQSLNTASGIRFGNDYCAPFSSLFNGEMDDVKFYNRLLSDSEIDTLASLLPFAAVHDKRVYEGNGTTVMDVKISLSHAYNEQVKINYRTADSTAIAPADYTATSGTIRFGVGRTQKHISITLNGNTTPENAKYFKVILSDPVNALLADSISVEKIKDDDTTVVPGKTNALQNISIAKSKITIAPNPAKDIIYISGSPDKNSVILVSDINGKTFIKQKAIEGRNSINISGIAPGNYFIQLIVEGKIQTFQFVKM